MAAGISPTLIGPYPGLELSTAAFTRHRSTESVGHLQRTGTPQLTLHDFHKCQQSPLLSNPPEYEHRSVKRRPSVNTFAGHPANAPFSWAARPASPPLIRPLPPRDQFASVLPHPHPHLSTTPRLQHNTTSPSLSSTVTTLQSTPTHTPILRGGSSFERRGLDDRRELVEPLRAKRKFPSLKRAKRLPHPADGSGRGGGIGGGSGSSSSSRAENDLWEVYAAVFDPPVELGGDIVSGTRRATEDREERVFEAPQDVRGAKEVRFATGEVLDGSAGGYLHAADGSSKSTHPHQNQEPAGTSSYSLSKFEFPVPPGHDNWAGTFGHLRREQPPNTPTTLLYRGASFDVVNPHASLLLDVYNFETPAEIDGLLDDYFDEPTTENMQYNPVTGSMSQTSLCTPTESSRRSRKLYHDADLARRSIMRSYDELPSPPAAHLHSSPLAGRTYASMPTSPDSVHDFRTVETDTPRPLRQPQWNTNTLRSLSAALGIGSNVDQGAASNSSANKVEEGRAPHSTPAAASSQVHSLGSIKDRSRRSNPFDLCISDSGSDIELANISQVLEHGRREEGGPIFTRTSDNEGEDSQATSTEPETDPAIREILDGYDYTRFNPFDDPGSSSSSISSIEVGLGVVIEASDEDDISDFGPAVGSSTQRPITRDLTKYTPQQAEFPASSLPTPPAPAHTGVRYYSGCSELPTSDQTYGETNQLLQITPEIVQYAPYSPGEKRYESPFTRRYADYYAATSMPLKKVRPRADSDPSKPVLSTYKPMFANDKENVPPEGSQGQPGDNAADLDNLLDGEQEFRFIEPDVEDVLPRRANRASSHYANDADIIEPEVEVILRRRANRASSRYANDAESAWESEFTDSHDDLTRTISQQSLASYADTSVNGSQHRSSVDDGIPDINDRRPASTGPPPDGPPQVGIGLSKTFSDPSIPITEDWPFRKPNGFYTTACPGVPNDAHSDRGRLVETPDSALPPNLKYSASVDTFTTIRKPTALVPFGREISTGQFEVAKQGQVVPLKPKRSMQGKVVRQTGLKELHLVKPKTRERRHPQRWTDAQYLAKGKDWLDDFGPRPYMTANSPLAKYTDPRSSSFDAKLSAKRLLVNPKLEEYYYPPVLYEERKAISKECLRWIAPFPVLTLAYGLGGLDRYMRHKTNGRIEKMAPKQKYEALYVYLPLVSLLWAIAAVIGAILIMAFHPGGVTSGGNSAPF